MTRSISSKVNSLRKTPILKSSREKKVQTLKLARINIEVMTTILSSGRNVSVESIKFLESLVEKFEKKILDRHSLIPEEDLCHDRAYQKDKKVVEEVQTGLAKIKTLIDQKRRGPLLRNSIRKSRPSVHLGMKLQMSEKYNKMIHVCSLILKIGGDGHVIFKSSFGKEKREEEILFCINNPFSSNPSSPYEFLLFLIVQMKEDHNELVENLSQINGIISGIESRPLDYIFSLNLNRTLFDSTKTLREFFREFKVLPEEKWKTADEISFQIRIKFVLGGDWKFLIACLSNSKLLYNPFNFQTSWYRKNELFLRAQTLSPMELFNYLPQIFSDILRENGNNSLFSSITTWYRWADMDLHMVIRIFTGLLHAEELVIKSKRLGSKLQFLQRMLEYGVSRSSNEFIPKDVGVKNYFFPTSNPHFEKRDNMKLNISKEISEAKTSTLRNNLIFVQSFENFIDKFINVFKMMRKINVKKSESKYRQLASDFKDDFLHFEEVKSIVEEIEILWQELPNFKEQFLERSPYYLNFFFAGLIIHLSTWFLFSQTSQQTQELINLLMNRLHHKTNKFGGKPPKTKEYGPILGDDSKTSKAKNSRSFETIVGVVNKFRIRQTMNLMEEEDLS